MVNGIDRSPSGSSDGAGYGATQRDVKECPVRPVALILVTLLTLEIFAVPADAGRPARPAGPSAARSDGVWQKRDGRLGYGWYSIYGDFVGTDGYTYTATPYRPGPANSRGWFLWGPGPSGATGFRP
jgi:hypothetical protein